MTMAVQSELQRLVPVSAEEAIEAQASDYAKQNPFLPDSFRTSDAPGLG